MESTLLAASTANSLLTLPKSINTTSFISHFQCRSFAPSSIHIVLPRRLARARLRREFGDLTRLGSVSSTGNSGALCWQPVRKEPRRIVSSSATGGGVSDDVSADVIVLHVDGMMCGGCTSSVKKILENQVSSATVDLTTGTATILPVSEAKAVAGWQKQLGEELAKHLTSCGFKSDFQGQGAPTEG
ncbi:PREDICTED: copper-transporting ATPase PAA2, chloroplastic-like isoform X2 [Ipomoea nil]|uniref:copper-transporting ATPase PAA2, chloroplastic-like isoform X2 n=1 Tax=Ipomoea nil TaxID=35883 RepID=UPI0009011455|nr:PREDICTED: copper-transporting ATPase PAA2, chloroplastic-like isoform X2 [Ipomoea nil]